MASTRRKISRKELKQNDFLDFAGDVEDFVTAHLTEVVIATVVVVMSALVVYGFYAWERHRDHLAASHFYQAFAALDAKQYRLAEDGFIKLASDEPNRRLGRLARFYLGMSYLEQNDLPRARDAFVSFVPDAHDATFKTMALMNLGVVYEQLGDVSKAEGAYRQAASVPGADSLDAELAVARMLEKQGKKEAAIEAYRSFLQAHPYANQRQNVIDGLARLGSAAEQPTPKTVELPK